MINQWWRRTWKVDDVQKWKQVTKKKKFETTICWVWMHEWRWRYELKKNDYQTNILNAQSSSWSYSHKSNWVSLVQLSSSSCIVLLPFLLYLKVIKLIELIACLLVSWFLVFSLLFVGSCMKCSSSFSCVVPLLFMSSFLRLKEYTQHKESCRRRNKVYRQTVVLSS